LMPITPLGGIQTLDEWREVAPFQTVKDYEDWIVRLRGVGVVVDQTVAVMQQGLAERRTQPRISMQRIPAQIAGQVVEDPQKSPFYIPFLDMPQTIPASEQERLRSEARSAIAEVVVPAYRRFQKFFDETYLPGCRETVGAWDLPDGAA